MNPFKFRAEPKLADESARLPQPDSEPKTEPNRGGGERNRRKAEMQKQEEAAKRYRYMHVHQ